jgi:hypothetical protein
MMRTIVMRAMRLPPVVKEAAIASGGQQDPVLLVEASETANEAGT